jgi:aminoglycoside phosphotransferase (APT) family kinase protein
MSSGGRGRVTRDVTAGAVARLVPAQFPQWAHLPVTAVSHGGWDNHTFRLGEELLARLPSAGAYVAQVEKDHRWLPVLARHLPLPIPEPVAMDRRTTGSRTPGRSTNGSTATKRAVRRFRT